MAERISKITDFKTYEELKTEIEIPSDVEESIRTLLYVDLAPYEVVKEILLKGKTASNITALVHGFQKGLSIKIMMEYLAEDDLEMSLSIQDALLNKVPRKTIEDMRECELSPLSISRLAREHGYRNRKFREGVFQLCIQKGMDDRQIRILLPPLDGEDAYQKLKVIADPELDWYQMETMIRFYHRGMTAEEAMHIVNPYWNCKKMIALGEFILAKRIGGEADENRDH